MSASTIIDVALLSIDQLRAHCTREGIQYLSTWNRQDYIDALIPSPAPAPIPATHLPVRVYGPDSIIGYTYRLTPREVYNTFPSLDDVYQPPRDGRSRRTQYQSIQSEPRPIPQVAASQSQPSAPEVPASQPSRPTRPLQPSQDRSQSSPRIRPGPTSSIPQDNQPSGYDDSVERDRLRRVQAAARVGNQQNPGQPQRASSNPDMRRVQPQGPPQGDGTLPNPTQQPPTPRPDLSEVHAECRRIASQSLRERGMTPANTLNYGNLLMQEVLDRLDKLEESKRASTDPDYLAKIVQYRDFVLSKGSR